ncbi:hypothetical protein KSF_059430 [Reticulibacter mediterranei]|uniref:Uncharacterized protein n=1 Tax=Reticulibacter mediterranei TaxID=2778369 RepID=A0A8J3IS56_9CHLR|nr:hypothetical protein [Reticulibacter mediterranei]GHO95895.1 hypothetical protein KSF_059430 [Reticulibacter mediterranei]
MRQPRKRKPHIQAVAQQLFGYDQLRPGLVLFDDVGYKTLSIDVVLEKNLLVAAENLS